MSKLRVLVADDHEQMRWAIANILDGDFTIVGAVANGRDLIQAAISLQPDVIVSDVSMPILTGVEAMQELRSGWHEVPFVLISSSTLDAEQWIEMGAAAIVDKADTGYDLIAAVYSAAKQEMFFSRCVRSSFLPELPHINSAPHQSDAIGTAICLGPQKTQPLQAGRFGRFSYGVD
jgi:DNA-binding NarL/FixJ family response regulator